MKDYMNYTSTNIVLFGNEKIIEKFIALIRTEDNSIVFKRLIGNENFSEERQSREKESDFNTMRYTKIPTMNISVWDYIDQNLEEYTIKNCDGITSFSFHFSCGFHYNFQAVNILKKLQGISMLIDTFIEPGYCSLNYKKEKSKKINLICETGDCREEDPRSYFSIDNSTKTNPAFRSALGLTTYAHLINSFPASAYEIT